MCECWTKFDEILATHNTRLAATFVHKDGQLQMRPTILTEWVGEKKRGKRPMAAIATHCPFCGSEYEAT
jgi:hypothetical protein